jgi:hypothetical protein
MPSGRSNRTPPVLQLVLALALAARQAVAQGSPDDDAKFNAKAALISARVIYLASQSYAGVTPKVLKARNPELSFVADAPSSGPAVLSVKVPGPKEVRIAVYGWQTCWASGRKAGRRECRRRAWLALPMIPPAALIGPKSGIWGFWK